MLRVRFSLNNYHFLYKDYHVHNMHIVSSRLLLQYVWSVLDYWLLTAATSPCRFSHTFYLLPVYYGENTELARADLLCSSSRERRKVHYLWVRVTTITMTSISNLNLPIFDVLHRVDIWCTSTGRMQRKAGADLCAADRNWEIASTQ